MLQSCCLSDEVCFNFSLHFDSVFLHLRHFIPRFLSHFYSVFVILFTRFFISFFLFSFPRSFFEYEYDTLKSSYVFVFLL